MKKKSILLASLLLLSSAGFAQKLSPSTSIMLGEMSTKQNANGVAAKTVSAFITVKTTDAVEKIEALGAKVNNVVSPTLLTATMPVSAIEAVSQLDEVVSVSVGTEVKLLMDQARKVTGVDDCHKLTTDNGPYTGKGVVVGIVDNGFDYTHVDFMNSDLSDTRIKRVWDQSTTGKAPEKYGYGAEYTSFAQMKGAKYDMTTQYHATHVAGIAAGGDKTQPYYGVAPDADLVFVSFASSNTNIVDGINYVFDYAESVGKPAVVNISLGSHLGPHDGTSDTDLSFTNMTGPGRIIVGACGNEGMEKLHVGKTLDATSTGKQLKTMFAYDSSSQSSYKQAYVDLWGSKGKKLAVKAVVVNTTKGQVVAQSDEVSTDGSKDVRWIVPDGSGVVASVQMALQVNPNNNCPEVMLMSRATSINTGFAIGIIATGDEGNTINAWNAANGGTFTNYNKRGWTDGDYTSTVGELGGTSNSVISVGSFNTKMSFVPLSLAGTGQEMKINENLVGKLYDHSAFSSYGPTADGRIKPDVTAPGSVVISAGSKYVGLTDDYIVAKNGDDNYTYNLGTSMASPFVAGTVALWLQANPNLTPDDVREIIRKSSTKDTYVGATVPNNAWGYGKINAIEGLKLALDVTGVNEIGTADKLFSIDTDRAAHTATFYFSGSNAKVAVYNTLGQQVYAKQLSASGETVDLSSLSNGVYVFKLQQGSSVKTVKAAL